MPLKIALISIALLMGQFSALVHAVEHPLHTDVASCDAYIALEKSDNGLITIFVAPKPPLVTASPAQQPARVFFALPTHHYAIRAPPAFS